MFCWSRYLNLNSIYWLSRQSLKFLLKLKLLVSLHVADTKLGKGDIAALLDNLPCLGTGNLQQLLFSCLH